MLKFSLLIVLNLLTFDSIACSRYPEKGRQNVIKTMMIIKVTEEKNKQIISSEKPWDKVSFELEDGPCGIPAASGKRYLFTSQKTIDELQKDKMLISPSNSNLSDIENLSAKALEKMINKKEFPEGRPNLFWGYCHHDEECIKLKNSCGEEYNSNKKYTSNVNDYFKNKKNGKCKPQELKEVIGLKVKCIENFCSDTK